MTTSHTAEAIGWTDKDEALLQQLRTEDLTYRQIAERMGRTLYSVKSKIERLNRKAQKAQKEEPEKPTWTDEDDQRIIELRKKQLSFFEIACEMGRPKKEVIGRAKYLGLKKASGSLTERELAYMHKRHKEGADIKTIAQELDRSVAVVRKRINAQLNLDAPRTYKTEARTPTAQELLTISDGRLAKDVRAAYQQVLTQASTVEMVLYTLYKTPKQLRPLSIEDAAVKLVRLVGKGPEYFHARREWRINDWFKHLTTISEEELP